MGSSAKVVKRADGKFDLPSLSPGQYQVVLWHGAAGKEGKPAQTTASVKIDDKCGAMIRWTLSQD